ncbi:unnamed protein product [Lactuca virosa]|uniref:Leucine-rich repeat domain, L domain-containing protein n=1 Tax=Lactuca virosa TaxID=75947 RepID=A0AAU9M233_9ASTR|nr:unnamed protein product [Lactuca virosa]
MINSLEKKWKMCKHAVDRRHGQLVDITIVEYDDADLLHFGFFVTLTNKSSQLKRLEVSFCYEDPYERWVDALKKLPLLEELSLYSTDFPIEAVEIATHYCPMLRTLKLNVNSIKFEEEEEEFHKIYNERAISIGQNLPHLRSLELIGNKIINVGLQAILDKCRLLESLDLRSCFFLHLEEEDPNLIGKKYLDKMKCVKVKMPKDSLQGCMYRMDFTDYNDIIHRFNSEPNMENLKKFLL